MSALDLHVHWDAVCTALRIPFHSRALPTRTRCPLCGGDALDIFHDNNCGGEWHHCRACGSKGDMLQLACAAWGTGPAAALARLSEAGVPVPRAALDDPEAACGGYAERRRVSEFWDRARAAYPNDHGLDVQRIRRRHHLRLDVGGDRWEAGPGALVGSATRDQVEALFDPAQNRGSRVLAGRKWRGVVLAPYYDLPGRVRAFSFLGRDGHPVSDHVFRLAGPGGAGRDEAGLAGWPAASPDCDRRYVIAVDDWLLALRIQFRHFRTAMRPLPLAVWRDDGRVRTRRAWEMLCGRRVVFWSPTLDRRVLMQAVEADGMIVGVGPSSASRVAHYLRRRPGTDLYRSLVAKARPWPEAMRRWMLVSPDGVVDDLLRGLELAGADVSHMLRQCGPSAAARTVIRAHRSISLGGARVTEYDDTWQSERGHRRTQLANFVVRVTHAVKDRDSGELYYYGVVRHGGREARFLERAGVVREDTLAWAGSVMVGEGMGVATCAASHARSLHDVALQFHTPEFVTDDLWRWTQKLNEKKETT